METGAGKVSEDWQILGYDYPDQWKEGPWVEVSGVMVGALGVLDNGSYRPTNSIAEIATSSMIRNKVREDRLLARLKREMDQ